MLGTDADGKAGFITALGPEWSEKPAVFPMDSLRIDIEGTHDAVPDYPNHVVGSLMEQLRWLTQQWWITRSTAGLLGYIRNSFGIDNDGLPLTDPDGLSCARTVTGFERPVTAQVWGTAIARLEADRAPPEHDLLVLDSHYFMSIGDFRRVVLDAVTACEQARDVAVERIYRLRSGHGFKRSRVIKAAALPDSLDRDLDRFIGRSYAREFPESCRAIRQLGDSRGRVAHGGPAIIRHESAYALLDESSVKPLVDAGRHCVQWLGELG